MKTVTRSVLMIGLVIAAVALLASGCFSYEGGSTYRGAPMHSGK